MQPLKELPAPAQLWKDKFLIQVIFTKLFIADGKIDQGTKICFRRLNIQCLQAAYVLEEDAEGTDAKTIFEKVC